MRPIALSLLVGIVNLTSSPVFEIRLRYMHIQDVSGVILNILGSGSVDYSE